MIYLKDGKPTIINQSFKNDLKDLKTSKDDGHDEKIKTIIKKYEKIFPEIEKKRVCKLTKLMTIRGFDFKSIKQVYDFAKITMEDLHQQLSNGVKVKKRSAPIYECDVYQEPDRKKIKTSDNVNWLSQLPYEILKEIKKYLLFDDIETLTLVNKFFCKNRLESIARSLNYSVYHVIENDRLLEKIANVKSVYLNILILKSKEGLIFPAETISKCTNLTSLNLRNFRLLENSFSKLTSLTALFFIKCHGIIYLSNLKKLENLTIENSSIVMKTVSPSLLSLTLNPFKEEDDQVLKWFNQLKKLDLYSVRRRFINLNFVSTHLEVLKLNEVTIDYKILNNFTHLRKLLIGKNIEDQQMALLPRQLKSLSIKTENFNKYSLLPTGLTSLSITFRQNSKECTLLNKITSDREYFLPTSLTKLTLNYVGIGHTKCDIALICQTLTNLTNLTLANFQVFNMTTSLKKLKLFSCIFDFNLLQIVPNICQINVYGNQLLTGDNILGYYIDSSNTRLPIQTNMNG